MDATEIFALVATCIGVFSFALVISILYRNYIKSSISEVESGKRDIELIDTMIYEAGPKVQKRRRVTGLAKTIAYYVFLVVAIPILGFAVYSRITNGVTMMGNSAIMVVASGSMSNKNEANDYLYVFDLNDQFQTFDLITLNKVDSANKLHQYDVIAYKNDENKNIIHRIISIDNVDGVIRYTTRGDANNATDTYRPTFEDVIGKYTGKRIPSIGLLISFFQSYAGIITVASVIFCLTAIDRFNRRLEEAKNTREETLSQVFDLSSMDGETYKEMASALQQRIYYQGYCYKFDEKGFVDKYTMTEAELKEFDSTSATTVTEDGSSIKKKVISFFKKIKEPEEK
ncbi:MAG: signal peptidase I [Bacilli bacterium]|nr:signal peptidase I [Bacilli bacterium]